jgi:hypothetical protein
MSADTREERPMPRGTTTERLMSSGNGSEEGRTYDDLYDEAKRRNIPGRSKMSKTELERALAAR